MVSAARLCDVGWRYPPYLRGAVLRVAVIGSGIAGLMAARELSAAGAEVVVIGSDSSAGISSASVAATGVVCAKGLFLARSPLFGEVQKGGSYLLSHLIGEIAAEAGRPVPQLAGVFEPFLESQGRAQQKKRAFGRQFTGAFRYQLLSKPAWPFCAKNRQCVEGFYYPQDGWFDPRALLAALRESLRRKDVLFLDDEFVDFSLIRPRNIEILTKRNRIERSDEVVFCCGNETKQVLRNLGVIFKSRSIVERPGATFSLPSDVSPCAWKFGPKSLAATGSRIYVGGFDVNGREQVLDEDNEFSRFLRKVYQHPEMRPLEGNRSMTKDRFPVIGEISVGEYRVLCSFGFYKSGFALAHRAARVISEIAQGNPSSPGDKFRDQCSPRRYLE